MSICHLLFGLFAISFSISAQSFRISTFAGIDVLRDGKPATTTLLRQPAAVATDKSGNLYISDLGDNRIRKVTPFGVMTTVAGNGLPGYSGDGGMAALAVLDNVRSMAFDPAGNLYLADRDNSRVRKITPEGGIITAAGNGHWQYGGDGGPAVAAQLDPFAVACDSAGNLYIADRDNYRIRKVTPTGVITTIAGVGTQGYSGDGGPAISAQLDTITALAVDSTGNIYFTDYTHNRIRKIDAAGIVTTIAGNGKYVYEGDGLAANLAGFDPGSIAVDKAGDIYIADTWNDRVRKIAMSTGIITTAFGSGAYSFFGDGGPAWGASFANPIQVLPTDDGAFFIVDSGNQRIRKVNSIGVISTVAGTSIGDGGAATAAFLNRPAGVVVGPGGAVVVSDGGNYRLRKVDSSGIITTLAGAGLSGSGGNNGQAVSALLGSPIGVAVDASGNYYVADAINAMVRKINPQGIISRYAGNGLPGVTGNGGAAVNAQVGMPTSICFDAAGNAYINDVYNNRIRKISPAGIITALGGNGKYTYSGDNGPATEAQFDAQDLAVDRTGVLYIADRYNHRIRRIDAAGVITTVVGTGAAGYSGDGGPANIAQLNSPTGVALDAAGNLYIADESNLVVRRVSPAGIITTLAGNGQLFYAGDGGPARGASLDPYRITVDSTGAIYVADNYNDRIRKLTPQLAATLERVSGGNQTGMAGTALAAPLVVAVRDNTGAPVAGVTVDFAVTAGTATLGSPAAVTNTDGEARTTVTLGAVTGTVTVTATVSGLAAVAFTATATVAVPMPTIPAGGVVGSGLSAAPIRALSPNAIASVFGTNFRPDGPVLNVSGADLVDGKLPTRFGGVCVLVGGVPAPIFAVHATQVNFQSPVTGGSATTVQVVSNCGAPNELRSNSEAVAVRTVTPEFYYFLHPADGKKPIVATYSLNPFINAGAPGLVAGAQFVPAKPDDLLTLYLTGFGFTEPAFAPGELPGRAGSVQQVQVSVGGILLPAQNVTYAGVTPGAAGLYQVNIRVPGEVPDGYQPVVVTVGTATTPTGYLTIQR